MHLSFVSFEVRYLANCVIAIAGFVVIWT